MTHPDDWPLARWARRAPSRRWPLVLLLLAALWGIAGGIEQIPL